MISAGTAGIWYLKAKGRMDDVTRSAGSSDLPRLVRGQRSVSITELLTKDWNGREDAPFSLVVRRQQRSRTRRNQAAKDEEV